MWRHRREKELLLLPLDDLRQHVLNYGLSGQLGRKRSKLHLVAGILQHECSEDLRRHVLRTFWLKGGDLPRAEVPEGSLAASYLACTLHRRYASYQGKPVLSTEEVTAWEALYAEFMREGPLWRDDPLSQSIVYFQVEHGRLPRPKRTGRTTQASEVSLPRELQVIALARDRDVVINHSAAMGGVAGQGFVGEQMKKREGK